MRWPNGCGPWVCSASVGCLAAWLPGCLAGGIGVAGNRGAEAGAFRRVTAAGLNVAATIAVDRRVAVGTAAVTKPTGSTGPMPAVPNHSTA